MSSTLDYRSFFREKDGEQRQYWGSEAAGALIVAQNTGRILLVHRSKNVDQPGTWGTIGGKVDFEETPQETISREVEEESGFDGNYKISHLYTYKDGEFKYHNYLLIIKFEQTPMLNWENDTSAWVEYGEWPDPLHFGMEELIKHAGHKIKRVIDLIKKKNAEILESMDVPPPAIIQHVGLPKTSGMMDKQAMINAYIVAATLWGEARGEGERGMQAVLNVIMNRTKQDFSKTKDIVLKPKQFSMWNGVSNPEEASIQLAKKMCDDKTYQTIIRLVDLASKGKLPDITGGATFYFNPKKVNPSWAKKLSYTITIGNHKFYKISDKSQQIKENDATISKQGLVDDGIYGYEMRTNTSYIRYGYEPNTKIFYLYNITTLNIDDRNKGYAKSLLETFFQFIKQNGGSLNTGSYTTSGMAYIEPVVKRLSKQYGIRLVNDREV